MQKMMDASINEYMEILTSSAPVPGGGGASAVGAALGMGLSNMVASLTTGKKKYAEYEEEICSILEQGKALQQELLTLSERDAEVFEPLSKLYALPKDTEEQQAYRREALSKASIDAALVPMQIAEKALCGMRLCRRVAEIGSRLAVSDAGCGILFLRAAIRAALYNVRINLPLIIDEEFVKSLQNRMTEIVAEAKMLEEETTDLVDNRL